MTESTQMSPGTGGPMLPGSPQLPGGTQMLSVEFVGVAPVPVPQVENILIQIDGSVTAVLLKAVVEGEEVVKVR